jgi:integrase
MIRDVYRPSRRNKNRQRVVGRMYRGRYRLNPRDKIKDVALHTDDKQVAEQRLAKIILEEQHEREGLIAPKRQREAAQRDLAEHVEDFIEDRRSVRRDEKYVRELRRKLLRLIKECSWRSVKEVTAESFCLWRGRHEQKKQTPKTLNEYLNAARSLMKWLEPRIGSNPLRFVQKVEATGEPRRARRAMTVAQLQKLISVSGERAIAYMVAVCTGIRRGELDALEWRDAILDVPQPFIAVRSSIAKNHKHVMQPLPQYVADALRKMRGNKFGPKELMFPVGVPSIQVFKRDLVAAGIDYKDAEGRYADFHALRKTFGTLLTLNSRSERTVMELMRHSDMKLTAKVYTDANMLPVSETVAMLPNLMGNAADSQIDSQKIVPVSPTVSATVPLKATDLILLTVGDEAVSPSESASVPQSPEMADGARCRVRTCDFLRVKQALYH